MDSLISILAWVFVIFVLVMSVYFSTKMVEKNKSRAFELYMEHNFPDLPAGIDTFPAKQKSKTVKLDIALIINKPKKEIVILLDKGRKGLKHEIYSFVDLLSAHSSDQVVSRGTITKQYSYERTIELIFKDGSSYHFIADYPSNKKGDDEGGDAVRDFYAPWEKKLKKILK